MIHSEQLMKRKNHQLRHQLQFGSCESLEALQEKPGGKFPQKSRNQPAVRHEQPIGLTNVCQHQLPVDWFCRISAILKCRI